MVFKRKIYSKILEWKNSSKGSTALLIEGARRIGKSTIVKEFGKNEYKTCLIINFADVSKDIVKLFDDVSDLNYLFLQLQLKTKVDLYKRESLIVFDEVQLCPKARQAIKKLVEDGRYDYIETGSLISIRKNVKDILIPSEERKLSMYPMDFEEFLWAKGDNVTNKLLRECFEKMFSLGDDTNRRLLKEFRLYMLVGGMPQAVDKYLSTNNFRFVDEIKRDILNLYSDDFKKIDETGSVSLLFNSIPAQLNKNFSRYSTSSIIGRQSQESILKYIAQMEDSKTALIAYHANDPSVGLSNNMDLGKFKMFIGDTGLFVTLMFKDKDYIDNVIYEKLLNDKLSANLGYLYENVVAQTLVANGYNLFYHTIYNETSKHNYEIDFLISKKNKICPIEVKSSGYNTHKSLDVFSNKYSSRILDKYLVYTKDLSKEKDIKCIPVYMAQFL